jgi:hypothetical protein
VVAVGSNGTPLEDESLEGGGVLGGGDDEGRLWMVGDRISIADVAVADLVSAEPLGVL